MKNRKQLLTLVDELIHSLHYYSDMGCRGFECSENGLALINRWTEKPHHSPQGISTDSGTVADPSQAWPHPHETLKAIQADLGDCRRCRLADKRRHIVFGAGNANADLVFVGEAPGYDEDRQGHPFVGKAGQLLTKIIQAMNCSRETVYICNVIKCRPPHNRNPRPDEIKACFPFLARQLRSINPKIICALGTFAAQTLLNTPAPISKLRGRFHDYHGIKLMPTFHPSFLLRNPEKKGVVWDDMQKIMRVLK